MPVARGVFGSVKDLLGSLGLIVLRELFMGVVLEAKAGHPHALDLHRCIEPFLEVVPDLLAE